MTTEREEGNLPDRRILLASDGSMPALAATKKAMDLAEMMDATVFVATVPEKTPLTVLEQMGEHVEEFRYTGEIANGPEVAREYGILRGIEVREMPMESGPIVGSILRVADEVKPDMIVIGNSGRSGWERITLGSVAEGVMRHSRYPVTMTKGYNKDELTEILSIANGLIKPSMDYVTETKVVKVPLQELQLGKRLGMSFAALLTFLAPYFGLGILNSFFEDVATTAVIGSMTVGLIWLLALFPLGIITGIGFHRLAAEYD